MAGSIRILMISDLHFSREDVSESLAFKWLEEIVSHHSPDVLLSCGDWGEDCSIENFNSILALTRIYSIYGNHDNLPALRALRNADGTSVLLEDKVVNINGLRIAGICGIIAERRRMKKGVPRKRPEEYVEAAMKIARRGGVDILLIHETPPFSEYRRVMHFRESLQAVVEAIEIIRPKLVLNGHLHFSPYTLIKREDYLYLRIISSQKMKHYALLDDSKISIYHDRVKVLEEQL